MSSITSEQPSRKRASWNSTKVLFVVLGGSCLASGVFNLFYAHQHHHHNTRDDEHNTAVHRAMLDFIGESKRGGGAAGGGGGEQSRRSDTAQQEGGANAETTNGGGQQQSHAILSCEKYGGPSPEIAQEMVYWQDIPSDSNYVSPFHAKHGSGVKRYMTFEPDGGGWNNIRMALETVLGLAIGMGRTLVLPPQQRMYLLGKQDNKQKNKFGFADFFPMHELAAENKGLEIITMKQFLEETWGQLRNKETGTIEYPPGNLTDFDGKDFKPLKEWLRNVTHTPIWSPGACMAAFPASGDHTDIEKLRAMLREIHKEGVLKADTLENAAIVPVDAGPKERMRENLATRNKLCVYDEEMQKESVVHFMCYHKMRVRMLVHFYAFLYFEDWREDLWMKRFMRDHVRYIDEIQCAAARIVHAMREYTRSRERDSGEFDTMHIRRGDFQFKATRIEAKEIYDNIKDVMPENTTMYIATDERDKKFFLPLKEHYDIKFLDDFVKDLLPNINSNYYGMIDQLVASRGRIFYGCWHSTFTGFINRMRGYHSVKDKLAGSENGLLPSSYYYTPKNKEKVMHSYGPLMGAFFNREFPTSWRDIDKSIGNLPRDLREI